MTTPASARRRTEGSTIDRIIQKLQRLEQLDPEAVARGERHHRGCGCASSAYPKMPNSLAAWSAVSAASSSEEHGSVITAVSLMKTCTEK